LTLPRLLGAEGGAVAGADLGHLLDDPFEILRPEIAAVDDDRVLGATDDHEIAFGHVAEIAAVEPAIRDRCGGGFRVVEIALHHALAADHHATHHARWQHLTVLPADLDRLAGERPAAAHQRAGAGFVRDYRPAVPAEHLGIDGVGPEPLVAGSEGDAERRLRQAVACENALAAETGGSEDLGE